MSGLDEMVELWSGCLRIGHRYGTLEVEKLIDRRELLASLSADTVIEYMVEQCKREIKMGLSSYGGGAVPASYRWWAIYCGKWLGVMEWRMVRERAGGYAHPSGLPSVEIACFYSAAKAAEAAIIRNREIFVSNQQTLLSTPTLSPSTEETPSS